MTPESIRRSPAAVPADQVPRSPRREIRMGSSQNLWLNSDGPLRIGRRLERRMSECFDPDWRYIGGGTQLGVYVTIDLNGRVQDVEVEDVARVPRPYRDCIRRVFRNGLRGLPPTVTGQGGRFWYVIPYRPVG